MSDHNISEFMQKNQADTSADIDESWALKLLNECEAEDAEITLDAMSQMDAEGAYPKKNYLKVVEESEMQSERLLSAIECQKLAFEEKQQAMLEAELAGKNRLGASFSRIRSFFA
jgi:hypothetical protein